MGIRKGGEEGGEERGKHTTLGSVLQRSTSTTKAFMERAALQVQSQVSNVAKIWVACLHVAPSPNELQ